PGPAIFGHRLVASGVEGPAILFALLVALQLVPLPASLVRLVSPSAARLFETSLPGWARRGVGFSRARSFLGGAREGAVASRLLDARAVGPGGLGAVSSGRRPLSIYPFATAQRLAVLLALLGLFAVAVNTLGTRRRAELLTRALIVLGFALSVFGVLQK